MTRRFPDVLPPTGTMRPTHDLDGRRMDDEHEKPFSTAIMSVVAAVAGVAAFVWYAVDVWGSRPAQGLPVVAIFLALWLTECWLTGTTNWRAHCYDREVEAERARRAAQWAPPN